MLELRNLDNIKDISNLNFTIDGIEGYKKIKIWNTSQLPVTEVGATGAKSFDTFIGHELVSAIRQAFMKGYSCGERHDGQTRNTNYGSVQRSANEVTAQQHYKKGR